MARKRMFSVDIIDSDAFLDMPVSAQALYFHLGMRADDDGFVSNPRRIMRMVGGAEDDIRILLSKSFILSFESGVVVIKHHRMNNNWDRHNCKRTVYLDEFNSLYIKENRAYTKDISQGVSVQSDSRLETVFRREENRIDKEGETSSPHSKSNKKKDMSWNKQSDDIADEIIIDADGDGSLAEQKKPQTRKYPNAMAVYQVFKRELGRLPANWKQNKHQLQSAENLFEERGIESIVKALRYYKANKDAEFVPLISSPYDLDSKWTKLGEFKIKNN
jgi:hypothetical protein